MSHWLSYDSGRVCLRNRSCAQQHFYHFLPVLACEIRGMSSLQNFSTADLNGISTGNTLTVVLQQRPVVF